MLLKFSTRLFVSGLFLALLSHEKAAGFTIDGDLSDWGVNAASARWIPGDASTIVTGALGNPVRGIANGITYAVEDVVGNYGYVQPGYGGQTFDVEAMYMKADHDLLSIAVVTGFPRSGARGYTAGDIALAFSGNPGAAAPVYTYGLTLVSHGSLAASSLYQVGGNGDWAWGLPDWAGAGGPTIMTGTNAVLAGSGLDVAYVQISPDRWVIEAAIPTSLFGDDWKGGNFITSHWAMTCGNDFLETTAPVPTPEPATIVLVGSALLGSGILGRRRLQGNRINTP